MPARRPDPRKSRQRITLRHDPASATTRTPAEASIDPARNRLIAAETPGEIYFAQTGEIYFAIDKGFDGLAAAVQERMAQDPFCGHLFVFRGRRGDLLKVLWWDGQGLCLFAKRLEKGRFVSLSMAQDVRDRTLGTERRLFG